MSLGALRAGLCSGTGVTQDNPGKLEGSADMTDRTHEIPHIERLGPNRWSVRWTGGAAFECDDRTFAAIARAMPRPDQRELFEKHCAQARPKGPATRRARKLDRETERARQEREP